MKKLKFILLTILAISMFGLTVCAEEGGAIVVEIDNHEVVAESIMSAFQDNQYEGMVTEVFSINNTINNCYYKPLAKDIPLLEESVLRRGFINAYTGYFDLDHNDEYRPDNHATRSVEVLGSDCLLMSESYSNGSYTAVEIPEDTIPSKVAVMNIYKAIDLPQYELTYYASEVSIDHLHQSPAVKDLPSFISDVDPKYGRMRVFTTRSKISLYTQKAQKDMKLSNEYLSDKAMTYEDFAILLMSMMDYYGEPVMSNQEMSAVLQVYGSTVPQYLTPRGKQAYLYLAARGILSESVQSVDWSYQINLTDMLDILMRVKDTGSRLDFKEIQITTTVSEGLQSKGFFARDVILSDKSDALQFYTEYDYSKVRVYDYYIERNENTKFVDRSGNELSNMFVPSIPAEPSSVALDGCVYNGIERDKDGNEYYHFKINIVDENSDYALIAEKAAGRKNMIQINTLQNSDLPAYWWLEQGGGVYTYASKDAARGVWLKRRPFKEGEFEGSVSKERKAEGNLIAENDKSVINGLLCKAADLLFGNEIVAKADYPVGTIVRVHIYNAHNITESSKELIRNSGKVDSTSIFEDKASDTYVVEMPVDNYEWFLANLKRDATIANNTPIVGIANIFGDVYLDYDDLVARGILTAPSNGGIPTPMSSNNEILVLDSMNGRLVLNNQLRQIVVGNTVYHVDSGSSLKPLFEYTFDAKTNKSKLLVDFRIAYGWTTDIVNIVITGNGDSFNVNIEDLDDSVKHQATLIRVPVNNCVVFSYGSTDEFAYAIKGNVVGASEKYYKYLATSGYSLANWMVYQGQTGDYLYIFYLRDMFESLGLTPPDDSDKMMNNLGYKVVGNDWVVREVELFKGITNEPGKFSYVEPFGYIYNVPQTSSFKMQDYLEGKILLPLVGQKNNGKPEFYNNNINYISGYPYGTWPKTSVNNNITWVDIHGNTGKLKVAPPTMIIKAAPAGVQALFGGFVRETFTTENGYSIFASANVSDQNIIYFGTSRLTPRKDSNGVYSSAYLKMGRKWDRIIKIDNTVEFMNCAKWTNPKNSSTYYRYVTFNDILTKDEASEPTPDVKAEVQIIDGDSKDEFVDMEEFSLMYILKRIDSATSWVIVFCFEILPAVALILLTIIIGLSYMSDSKITQWIVHKTFDPVKIVTFGKVSFDELSHSKAFWGLIFAYITFACLLDGNFLRILMWLSEMFETVSQLARQISF